MNPNIHIAYRHVPPSAALSRCIADEVAHLEHHVGHALESRTVVEPVIDLGKWKRWRVRVEVAIRGKRLVSNRMSANGDGEQNAYSTVREAFRSLRRQIDTRSKKLAQFGR